MKIGRVSLRPFDAMLVFVPIAVVMEVMHAEPVWIFVVSCLAIIPLAGWLGHATEHLAAHFGPGVGGLLNATFGNAAEMIIAVMALRKGLNEVVLASLTGSIIGNILLVLGLSMLLGGLRHQKLTFNKTAAGLGTTLLAISAIGLLVPGFVGNIVPDLPERSLHGLSMFVAAVLIVTYVLSLLFSLRTHAHLYQGDAGEHEHDEPWGRGLAIGLLIASTFFIAIMSEFLVGSVEETADAWGMSHVFVGVILVAIVGNAAEHSTAILVALKKKMDLSFNIAVGSGIQIALLIAPTLVFLSYPLGHPLDLVFTPLELVAISASVIIVSMVAQDGETHWMEGVLLLAVYAIFAAAFFLVPG